MNKLNNKIFATIITIAFVISSLLVLAQAPNVSAQTTQQTTGPLPSGVTPDAIAHPVAFLSFSPTVIGLNQEVLVNVWTTPAPGADRHHHDYIITVTAPDGTKDVRKMDSYVADGTAWFSFAPDQLGTYQIKFDFQGTYFPAGRYSSGNIVNTTTGTLYDTSVYYQPDSTEQQNLTVRQDMVSSWPPASLPTDYWTRPVSPLNREWWTILGNFPWANGNTHDFAGPYVIAPNTAHIVWRVQGGLGGLVGGDDGQLSIDASQSIGVGAAGNPSVIYNGRAYVAYVKPGVGNVAACFDIRTGEVFYEVPNGITPSVISYTQGMSVGAELLSIGTSLIKINPWTGLVTTNVTGMAGTFHSNNYVLSVQTNNTAAGYRLINWTTSGTSTNFASRIISNVSWPINSLGTAYDLNTGVAVTAVGTGSTGGAFLQQNITGISMSTGKVLWSTIIDGGVYSGSCDVADNGKVAILDDKGYFVCFDLVSGKQLWQSPTMDYPWDAPAFGAYDIGSAYGMIYRSAYSGVYAFDWNTGNIVWKFEAPVPAAFETPYIDSNGTSIYSWNGGMLIADGKVFTYNTEHSPSEPITRGWKLFAINATTGTNVWNITAYSGSRTFRGGAADGYLAFDNFYDAYMTVFGRGISQTTVTAPTTTVPMGTSVLIQGTVMDQSPAQPNTPCVSASSMGTQMEYLHMQQPIAGIWNNATITGIPVTLTAIDSNNNAVIIGTVTTNGYYGTFAYTWSPPKEGAYTITASFSGDDSYGSSSAATGLSIGAAPSTPTPVPTQAAQALPPIELYFAASTIALIIAIAIAVLIIKKR